MGELLTIYNASAGSGKTTTLIREIISILLQNDVRKIRQVLGLTFTNAVANELKKRLISVLYNLAFNKETFEDFKAKYIRNIELNDEKIKEQSKKILFHILHNYSDVSLQTIDSFSNRILKSFAYELNYSIAYQISTNQDEYYSKSLDNFLDSIEGNDNERLNLILSYIAQKKGETEGYNLNRLLNEIIQTFKPLVEKESAVDAIQSMKEKVQNINVDGLLQLHKNHKKILEKQIEEFNRNVREILEKYIDFANNEVIKNSPRNDWINKQKTGRLNKLYQSAFENFKKDFLDFISEYNSYNKKGGEEQNENLVNDLNNLVEKYHALENTNKNLSLIILLVDKLVITKIALELLQILNQLKQEDDVVFFSDFTKEISKVIQNETNVDFIYEKAGTRYNHFLIDEFQDTSTLQFHNLLPLIHNSMASRNKNFIVGDPKQSIYRWRNANVQQFVNLYKNKSIELERLVDEWERFKKEIHTTSLDTNYRSHQHIVEFNNLIFNNLTFENIPLIESVYENCAQKPIKQNDSGYVEILHLSGKNKDERFKLFSENTLNIIKDCIAKGYQQKDICILLRTNDEIKELIEQLRGANISDNEILQFISPEGMEIYSNDEVEFIVAFLEQLLHPQNKIASGICWNYVNKINKNQFEYSADYDRSFFIEKYNNDQNFKALFSTHQVIQQDLYQLCLNIISYFNLPFHSAVQKFLDIVNKFIHQYALQGNNIEKFLEFWDKYKHSYNITLSSELNAVKIMTIHKSKGLEFPVVITNINFNRKDGNYWYKIANDFKIVVGENIIEDFNDTYFYLPTSKIKDINENDANQLLAEEHLENINIIYVAFTRAVERLYIFTNDKSEYVSKIILNEKIIPKPNDNKTETKNNNPDKKEDAQGEVKIFYFGNPKTEPHQPSEKSDNSQNTELLKKDLKLNYNKNILLANNYNKYNDEIDFGIKVHKTLEFFDGNNVEYAVRKAIAKGIVRHSEKENLTSILQNLSEQEKVKTSFRNVKYILNECPVFASDEQVYRPDKIIVKENGIIVLEFKTGEKNKKHLTQIENYINQLNTSNKNISGLLIYFNKENTIEVIEVQDNSNIK